MLNTCQFVLAPHQPCHAPALHNGRFCRHHTPEARARRQARLDDLYSDTPPAPQPRRTDEEVDAAHLRAYWRMHHRTIATSTDDEQCQQIYDMILMALGERAISPRSAGKLLLAVMDRRKVLAEMAKEAAFRAMTEQTRIYRQKTAAGESPDPKSLLDTLRNVVPYLPPLPDPPDPRLIGQPDGRPDDPSSLEALLSTLVSSPESAASGIQPFGGPKS
jgi:hypothetical protein